MRTQPKRKPGFYGDQPIDIKTPVLILGGKENALSLCRSLARTGIRVSISGKSDCWGQFSSFCSKRYPISKSQNPVEQWKQLLLGDRPVIRERHVTLACCDTALEFLAEYGDELRDRHLFDAASPDQIMALLDKQQTLALAEKAGIGFPKFWQTDRENFDASDIDCQYPVLVKPRNTFKFAKVFGRKFFTVETGPEDLQAKVEQAHRAGFDVSIVEKIPGPDDLLSSYYTYIDGAGQPLFHFTKSIVRRYPVNSGGATCHLTEWLPETASEGFKFFRNIGFRGLGNIELKRDPRDGKLKIIEVNARFTAAQELVIRSGAPLDLITYCALTGQRAPVFANYTQGLAYWYPIRDFLAFMELNRKGQLSLSQWLKNIPLRQHVDPVFDLGDLKPSIEIAGLLLGKAMKGRA